MQTLYPNTAPQVPPSFSHEPEGERMYWLSNLVVDLEKQRIARANKLGIEATGAFLDENSSKLEVENSDITADKEEHKLETLRDIFLDKVRNKLAGLTDSKRQRLDSYLDKSAPKSLYALNREDTDYENLESGSISWTTWLSKDSTNDQLLKFLDWHIDTLEQQQNSEQVERLITQQRKEYKKGVKKGVREGWLHKDAAMAATKVDNVHILVGDIFDTILEDNGGYVITGSNVVVISPGVGATPKSRERNFMRKIFAGLKHELNHKNFGFMAYRWLDEALAEHVSQSLKNGSPEELLPFNRPKDPGIYKEERSLLHGLLNYGNKKIPVSVATRAYSDPRGTKGKSYKVFSQLLDESWGSTNVLDQVQGKIEAYETELEQGTVTTLMDIRGQAVKMLIAEFNKASNATKSL